MQLYLETVWWITLVTQNKIIFTENDYFLWRESTASLFSFCSDTLYILAVNDVNLTAT